MATIRRLNCFDVPKIKKMISYLGMEDGDKFLKAITKNTCAILHEAVPLKYKFLPESFILMDGEEIHGLITVVPTYGNPYKINITRLVFHENFYDIGKQLVDFIMVRYGARGASSFHVLVDQSHDELLMLFMDGCGFRQCSYENLWKLENFDGLNNSIANFRHCQNTDAKAVSRLFNAELKTHFRPSLERTKEEYKEPIFAGFVSGYKSRYVLEEPIKNRIIAYLSITTNDNLNFIIDMSVNDGYDVSYDEILNFAYYEIAKRKSKFFVFLKQKQYTKTADKLEDYLHKKEGSCIQTQCVLVKDYYKPIKQTESPLQIFLFGENNNTITN